MNNSSLFKYESSGNYSPHPEIYVIVNVALNAALMFITITGNTLVLTAISRTPALHSPSITLLCSLAVSDLLVGLVIQPLYIAKELTQEPFLLQISDFMTFGCCGVSLYTVTAISVDRFAALHYHMRYITMVTTTRVIYTLVFGWLFIFIAHVIYILNKSMYFLFASIFSVFCVLIFLFCYIRIFQIVHRHQLQIHAQQQAVQTSDACNNFNMTLLKKSTMNTLVFCIVLILCYLPNFTILIVFGIVGKEWTPEMELTAGVVFMNSSINPFLYCWRLRELRTAVLKTVKWAFCTQVDRE